MHASSKNFFLFPFSVT